jgi:hypothetical protein
MTPTQKRLADFANECRKNAGLKFRGRRNGKRKRK